MRDSKYNVITWTLILQDGNETFFRIKRNTHLKKLMNAYCDRQSLDFNSVAYLFDGRRLRGDQTPDEVCKCHLLNFHLNMFRFLFYFYIYMLSIYVYEQFLTQIIFLCSLKWRMEMKQMPCFIRQEVLLFEGCSDRLPNQSASQF